MISGRSGGLPARRCLFFHLLTLPLIEGPIVANVVQLLASLNIDPASLDVQVVNTYAPRVHEQSVTSFLMNVIPA